MTVPVPGADARVDRIRTQRSVQAMVAADTVGLLADRVATLLSHGRRMALAHRYPTHDTPPGLEAGLTVVDVVRHDHGGIGVYLSGGPSNRFGFHGLDYDTEARAWARFHADDRVDLMRVELVGGQAGDGPAGTDRIVVTRWNSDGVCHEVVIAFDPGADRG